MAIVDPETLSRIAKLRAVGYSNKEIADELGLHPSTVSYQIQKMKSVARNEGVDDAFNQFLLGAAVGAGAVALGLLLAELLKKK